MSAIQQTETGGDSSGNVPVLAISVQQSETPDAEINLNLKVMGHIDATAEGLHTCPCGTNEVKPLAAKLAASL